MQLILHELILFAAVGFLIGGVDDLLVDLLWVGRTLWRRVAIYSRHQRATVASLPPPRGGGPLAIFVPAWDEARVIDKMLRNCVRSWNQRNYLIFVGCYLNDVPSQAAVAQVRDPRIRLAVVPHYGPTTKSDCLNHLWRDMLAVEAEIGRPFSAVILHDAEDVVHPDELVLFGALIDRFSLIQIPVAPLVDRDSRWISGHYLDEFAEAHGKALIVRESVGAAIPSAGVGCALSRDALNSLAAAHDGLPFGSGSLTEDYELGLRLAAQGHKGAFVRLLDRYGERIVAVRAHFPSTLRAAVRQKTRWIIGIALAGWSRLGWEGGVFETWMRVRDRRAILAAFVLLAGYLSAFLALFMAAIGTELPRIGFALQVMLIANGFLLLWRLMMRAAFVSVTYGWREGVRAIPRAVISNAVALMSTYRALFQYVRLYRSGKLVWAKTEHKFPDTLS